MVLNVALRRRPVEIARCVSIEIEAAAAVLREGANRLIGPEFPAPWSATGADPRLGVVLPGGVRLTREVRLGTGPVFEEDGAVAVAVWWEAAEHPHLFPTFDGALEVRPSGDGTTESELRLAGSYAPPLGRLGRFADGLVGHRVVIASLEALLAAAAERLVAASS